MPALAEPATEPRWAAARDWLAEVTPDERQELAAEVEEILRSSLPPGHVYHCDRCGAKALPTCSMPSHTEEDCAAFRRQEAKDKAERKRYRRRWRRERRRAGRRKARALRRRARAWLKGMKPYVDLRLANPLHRGAGQRQRQVLELAWKRGAERPQFTLGCDELAEELGMDPSNATRTAQSLPQLKRVGQLPARDGDGESFDFTRAQSWTFDPDTGQTRMPGKTGAYLYEFVNQPPGTQAPPHSCTKRSLLGVKHQKRPITALLGAAVCTGPTADA